MIKNEFTSRAVYDPTMKIPLLSLDVLAWSILMKGINIAIYKLAVSQMLVQCGDYSNYVLTYFTVWGFFNFF